jgi:Homeodomain-like domain
LISRETPIGTSPLAHARYLHNAGKGSVTLGQKKCGLKPPGDWKQHSYPVEELYEVVPAYSGLDDVYITHNRFYGARAVSRLAELSAMYSDLDYYKIGHLAQMPAKGVMELALETLLQARIPYPSLGVKTGRGIALVWRHEPEARSALPKWNLCQSEIYDALKPMGADPLARDAARVLRLSGTYNSRSKTLVESIFENLDYVWGFGELADEILPLTSEELEELRAQHRAEKDAREARMDSEHRRDANKRVRRSRFTVATLSQDRLSDLQRLVELRGLDQLPPGQRNSWMFAATISLSYLVEPQVLEREIITLGRDYAGWSERETRSRMQTAISRAHAASVGDKVEWNGQQRDPRYRLKNQTIIDMLGITPSEEKEMQVLISKDTKRQRERERKERERRSRGAKPRDEYLAEASEKRRVALELHQQGMSLRKIGERLGVSHTQIKRIISTTP